MTDHPEPDPDRSPPARPVRVARFDGFLPGDRDPGEEPPSPGPVAGLGAVATFDALHGGTTSSAVAAFDGLGDQNRPGTVVAGFDGLGAARPEARRPEARRPESRRDLPVDEVDRAPAADDPSEDGGVPPDRPLPRGRRRGARAGRLGPDAPDPDGVVPGSEPAADPVSVAREICLRLLTDRARTRQELAQALARKGVPADATATVLDRFDEVGLIDDAAFAGQWVRSRHAHRGLARRAIAVELRRKGVADDIAGEALAEVDTESEDRRARELVDRKLRSIAVDTAEQRASAARRLVGMLARKGYGGGTAYRVVREALAERGADVDELGDGHDG